MSGESNRPRIDWTFPIWGVVGIGAQMSFAIWWAAGMTADSQTDRGRIEKLEGRVAVVESRDAETKAVLAMIAERLNWIMEDLKGRKK